MNAEIAMKAIAHLEEEHRRLNMDCGITMLAPEVIGPNQPPCGTVMCFAGAVVMTNISKEKLEQLREKTLTRMTRLEGWSLDLLGWCSGVEPRATELLEITAEEGEKLFYVDQWPKKFSKRYKDAHDNRDQAAKVAVLKDYVLSILAEQEKQ